MATLEEKQTRSKYDHLMAQCQRLAPVRIALAHAWSDAALAATVEAANLHLSERIRVLACCAA